MLATYPAVPFCEMAQKDETPIQLGARVSPSLKKRIDDFCVNHPWQPSLAFVVEQALTQFLEREEPKLPKPSKPARK